MNAAALRERLAADGIHLDVEGDRLVYEGPPAALTAAVLDELRAAAEALRGLLREEQGVRSAYAVLRGGEREHEHEHEHEQEVRSAYSVAPGPAALADADREALRAEIADLPVEDQLVILGYLQCRHCRRWLLAKECEPDAEAQPVCRDRADCREAVVLRAGTARPLAAPTPPPAELHLDL